MTPLPPLIELRAFEAAARHLSFKAAAAELGVTPTAISHQVRLREQHCGQPLFRRRPRPLTLTAAGERLLPTLRDGFSRFSDALASVRVDAASGSLRVTATNAFSARLLVPRLPLWQSAHPGIRLDIHGTDDVLNLKAGQVDVAIRYARQPPSDGVAVELMRDTFHVVAAAGLARPAAGLLTPAELATLPLIACGWPAADGAAPTWQRWEAAARARHRAVPSFDQRVSLSFHEELHAIEAVIGGQGAGILSDVLVGAELSEGVVHRLSDVSLPGYGFYAVYRNDSPKKALISTFCDWLHTVVAPDASGAGARRRPAMSARPDVT